MFDENSKIRLSCQRKCKSCGLFLNQLPIFDERKASSIFWVGLSSVPFSDDELKMPLSPYTKSGALIGKIEEPYLNNISFYKTNVVKCLPLTNNKIRYPSKNEMEKCFPNLTDEIEELKPEIIFLLGAQVAKFILGKLSVYSFSLNENFKYESYFKNGITYVPNHHPSYILVYKRKLVDEYIKGISAYFQNVLELQAV